MLPFFIWPVALIWTVQHDPFFWDTVQLASKHAHHFHQNGLVWTTLPQEIDSGHPPVFGYYIALVWTFFGKNLPASHWAMLPFLLLNVWLLFRIGRRLGGDKGAFWLIPLAILDPVVAGQSALVSPDIPLVSFFLLAVLGILEGRTLLITIGITGLCAISMRGMMTAGALGIWQILPGFQGFNSSGLRDFKGTIFRFLRFAVEKFLPFLPGLVFSLWFLWWHRQATGWMGYHAASPWAPTFEPAKGAELLRNLAVLGWRWFDFGRVFEWLLLIGLALKMRTAPARVAGAKPLFLLLICLVVFLSPSAILFKNVSAHRYFLPGFLALHFLVFQLIVNYFRDFKALKVLIVALALGNLWVYPRGIAMGWDSTLAHLPYHELRDEAVRYLEKGKIDFQKVGTLFPNLNTGENLMLNGDHRRFADMDFSRNEYIFASNIFNDLSEDDYNTLRREWILIKKWQQSGVWIEIYERAGLIKNRPCEDC